MVPDLINLCLLETSTTRYDIILVVISLLLRNDDEPTLFYQAISKQI